LVVKRFKGHVVKRMRRVPGGILLTLLAPIPGERGQQVTISQAEWDAYGSVSYVPGVSRADLRGALPPQDPPTP
jgi:hypothetical protein